MNTGDAPVSWLMFFTLGIGLLIAVGAMLSFLRSQRNRDIAHDALTKTEGGPKGDTRGALPDLLSVAVFACIAMGLLIAGYSHKASAEKSMTPPPVGAPSATR